MAIKIKSYTTKDIPSTAATSTIVLDKPSGVAVGDLLVIMVGHDSATGGATPPSGWTEVIEQGSGAVAIVWMAYKIADGTEGSTETVTYSWTNTYGAGWYLRITGQHTTDPLGTSGSFVTNSNTGSIGVPALTTENDTGSLAFAFITCDGADMGPLTISSPTDTWPTSSIPSGQQAEAWNTAQSIGIATAFVSRSLENSGSSGVVTFHAATGVDGMSAIQWSVRPSEIPLGEIFGLVNGIATVTGNLVGVATKDISGSVIIPTSQSLGGDSFLMGNDVFDLNTAFTTTVTFSDVTVPAGVDRMLIVTRVIDSGEWGNLYESTSFDGNPMTAVNDGDVNSSIRQWYYPLGTSGSSDVGDIVVQGLNGSTWQTTTAIALTDIQQAVVPTHYEEYSASVSFPYESPITAQASQSNMLLHTVAKDGSNRDILKAAGSDPMTVFFDNVASGSSLVSYGGAYTKWTASAADQTYIWDLDSSANQTLGITQYPMTPVVTTYMVSGTLDDAAPPADSIAGAITTNTSLTGSLTGTGTLAGNISTDTTLVGFVINSSPIFLYPLSIFFFFVCEIMFKTSSFESSL